MLQAGPTKQILQLRATAGRTVRVDVPEVEQRIRVAAVCRRLEMQARGREVAPRAAGALERHHAQACVAGGEAAGGGCCEVLARFHGVGGHVNAVEVHVAVCV